MPFNPAEPAAALYGVIPQAYAQRLATVTGDPTVDAINALNLGSQARNDPGRGEYLSFLRDTNTQGFDASATEARIGAQKDIDVALLNNMDDMNKGGFLRGVNTGPESFIYRDPTVIAEADAAAIQAQQAENLNKAGTGAQAFANAGYRIPAKVLPGILTPPQAEEQLPNFETDYIKPVDKANLVIEEHKAESARIAANKPPSSSSGDVRYTDEYDADGNFVKRSVSGKGEPPKREPRGLPPFASLAADLKSKGYKVTGETPTSLIAIDAKGNRATFVKTANGGSARKQGS